MIKYSSTGAPRHQGGTWEPIGEKYHGGNAMEEIRRPLAAHGLQPGRKSGIWPWEFNTRPGTDLPGASNKYIHSLGLGQLGPLSVAQGLGVSVLSQVGFVLERAGH